MLRPGDRVRLRLGWQLLCNARRCESPNYLGRVPAVVATPDLWSCAMSMQKKRPQSGPDAPLTAERKQYRRLMAQGVKFQIIRFWRRFRDRRLRDGSVADVPRRVRTRDGDALSHTPGASPPYAERAATGPRDHNSAGITKPETEPLTVQIHNHHTRRRRRRPRSPRRRRLTRPDNSTTVSQIINLTSHRFDAPGVQLSVPAPAGFRGPLTRPLRGLHVLDRLHARCIFRCLRGSPIGHGPRPRL